MIGSAIVGLGRWGRAIIEAAHGSKRLRFVRGISKEPETVVDFAATNGLVLSTEYSDALNDPGVQAVFLATPHSLHVKQIMAAATTVARSRLMRIFTFFSWTRTLRSTFAVLTLIVALRRKRSLSVSTSFWRRRPQK